MSTATVQRREDARWEQTVETERGHVDISELRKGDKVRASSGEFESVRLVGCFGTSTKRREQAVVVNGSLAFHPNQSLVLHTGQVIHAKQLSTGMKLLDRNGNEVLVRTRKQVNTPRWHRFTLIGVEKPGYLSRIRARFCKPKFATHTYYVNGILCHNASRFWVGGTGNWDQAATTHWSATNGGAGGASVPTAADDVFFTASSGAGTCTMTVSGPCRSLNSTSPTNSSVNFTHNSSVTITVGDATAGAGNVALDLSGFTTYTRGSTTSSSFSFVSSSATTQTIKFHTTAPGSITWNNATGSWQMLNGYTNTSSVWTPNAGTIDWNGQTFSVSSLSGSNVNARTLVFGSANITLNSTGTAWTTSTNTNLTISPNTATVTFVGNPATLSSGTNTNFNGMSWVVTTNGSTTFSTGNGTWGNLTLASTGKLGLINVGNLNYTGTLTLGGATVQGVNRLGIISSTAGTARTLNGPAVVINGDVDLSDCSFVGSPTWTNASNAFVGDGQGNTGITATTSAAQTWSGTSGGNWSANAWTTRMPLPQDDVTINAAFAASQTITIDVPRIGRSVNFTGATGSPTVTAAVAYSFYGSLTLISAMTWTTASLTVIAGDRRGGSSLTTAGKTMAPLTVNAFGGGYTQQDALAVTSGGAGSFTLNGGTWNTNGFTTTFQWSMATSLGTTFNQGTSTVNIGQVGLGSAAATPWNINSGATYTWAPGASINIVQSIATTRTFAGGAKSYPPLNYTLAGSTGGLAITGATNSFAALNVTDASNGRTVTFPSGSTTAIDSWGVNGTAGNFMSIASSTPGTQAFLAGKAFTDPYSNPVYVSGVSISGGAINLPAVANNYAFSPYAAPLGITGDLDIRAYVNPTSWTVATTSILVGREQTSSTLSFSLALQTSKRVTLRLSQTGATTTAALSTAVPFADGTAAWVRATYQASLGQVQFWYSTDGPNVVEPNWTLLTTTTTTVTSIADLGSQVEIGTRLNGTNSFTSGQIYRAVIKNGIGGTSVYDANFLTTQNAYVGDYLSVQDSNAAGAIWQAELSTNVSDNTGWVFGRQITVLDNEGLIDAESQTYSGTRMIQDSAHPTDLVSETSSYLRSVSEAEGLADSLLKTIQKTQADAEGLTDALSRRINWVRTITDALGLADSTAKTIARVISDAENLTDGSVLRTITAILIESLVIEDPGHYEMMSGRVDPLVIPGVRGRNPIQIPGVR